MIRCQQQSHPIVLIYGTLQSNQVESLTDDVARSLIWQHVSALKFMHIKRIAHHDEKPANLLVTAGDIVWPLQSSNRPHSFVANSVFRDKDQVALPRPYITSIAPIYLHLHPSDDTATN